MKECLVDVLNAHDRVLHVFPITVEDQDGAAQEAECVQKALRAAARLQLVAETETENLKARMHVSRGGQLSPVSDVLQVRQESQERAEQRTRIRAYFLWQQEGRSESCADEYWRQACKIERHGSHH